MKNTDKINYYAPGGKNAANEMDELLGQEIEEKYGKKQKRYVAGFLFSPDFKNVVLIEKEKPAWQKGKYNGIGGKIEKGEYSAEAMRREFEEETALDITDWKYFCQIYDPESGASVDFYYASSDQWDKHWTTTIEEVFHLPVDDLYTVRACLLPNLWWLIHLAIDKAKNYSGIIKLPLQ